MTSLQMILSRVFFFLFGWIPGISQMAKKILIQKMIKKSPTKYVASSRYFSWKDLA